MFVNTITLEPFEIHLCVSLHDKLKTVADICFLLGSYVDWRNIWDELTCQGHRSWSRSFFEGFKVIW